MFDQEFRPGGSTRRFDRLVGHERFDQEAGQGGSTRKSDQEVRPGGSNCLSDARGSTRRLDKEVRPGPGGSASWLDTGGATRRLDKEVRPRGSTRRFDQEVEPGRFDQKIPSSGWTQEVRHRDSTKDGAPREFLAASPGAHLVAIYSNAAMSERFTEGAVVGHLAGIASKTQ